MKKKCIIPGCKHVAKSAPGLSAHIRRAHVDAWKGSIKNTQAFLNGEEIAAPKKKTKRRYKRQAVGARKPSRRLQRAAISDEVNFCPRCACNLEAVRMALSFAAGNR